MKALQYLFAIFCLMAGVIAGCSIAIGVYSRAAGSESFWWYMQRYSVPDRFLVFGALPFFLAVGMLLLPAVRNRLRRMSTVGKTSMALLVAAMVAGITLVSFYEYVFMTERERVYLQADWQLERHGPGSLTGQLFASLGDYLDAGEKAKQCFHQAGIAAEQWAVRGTMNSRDSIDGRKRRVEELQKARNYFVRADDFEDSAARLLAVDTEIAALSEMNLKRERIAAEIAAGNYEAALAGLEPLRDEFDWKDLTQNLRRKIADSKRDERLDQLERYLKAAGSSFSAKREQSFGGNLSRLYSGDPVYRGNIREMAELLAKTRSYIEVADAFELMELEKSEKYPHRPSQRTGTLRLSAVNLSFEELVVVMARLAVEDEHAAGFQNLLPIFRKAVENEKRIREHIATLLLIGNAGTERLGRIYPDNSIVRECEAPGTLFRQVLEAPDVIKDVFMSVHLDRIDKKRPTRLFTPDEAEALFTGFVPRRPFWGGYVYISEHVGKLEGVPLNEPSERDFEYKADGLTVLIAKGSRGAGGASSHDGGAWEKEGGFVCVSNPDNARLAVYETHRYEYIGKYNLADGMNVSDKQVDVYLPKIHVKVVDLLTRKTLVEEEKMVPAESRYALDRRWLWPGDIYCPPLHYNRSRYLHEKIKVDDLY